MKEVYKLLNIEQVKALADPLRLQVLEQFSRQPMTTKQVATALNEKPTKLYHHVDTLENAGLIELVKTQANRGTIERYYQAVARKFTVDRKLFELKESGEAIEELQALFTNALEATIEEISESIGSRLIRSGTNNVIMARVHICASKDQVEKLIEKFEILAEECRAANTENGEMEYGVTMAFYPIKERKKGIEDDKK